MSDDYGKFYTGLPNITILKAVFDHVLVLWEIGCCDLGLL